MPSILERDLRRTKQAAPGAQPGPDGDFEQQFSSMAVTYVQDRSPRLMPYMVGFQLIDRDNDGEKAVGVFGAKAGELWLYVPVFFLGGRIKGQELLWIQGPDRFVPNKENWVNALLTKEPFQLGEASPNDTRRVEPFSTPNVRRIARPWETMSKDARFRDWSMPFVQKWARARLGVTEKVASQGDLVSKLLSIQAVNKFASTLYRDPVIKMAFDRWYGVNALASAMAIEDGQRRAAATFPAVKVAAAKPKPKVRVYFYDGLVDGIPGVGDLNEDQKRKLLQDRRLVLDARGDDEVSRVYDVQTPVNATNPSVPGKYNLIRADGTIVPAIVLTMPKLAGGQLDKAYVVPLEGGTGFAAINVRDLWGVSDAAGGSSWLPNDTDFADWFQSLPEATSAKADRRYIAVGPNGECTTDFQTYDSLDKNRFRGWATQPRMDLSDGPRMTSPFGGDDSSYVETIQVNAPGASPMVSAGTLRIPSTWRLVDCGSTNNLSETRDQAFSPGTPEDIQAMGLKEANLRIRDDGNGSVEIKTPDRNFTCTKKAALVGLICDMGLREDTAALVLEMAEKQARRMNKSARFIVKHADSTLNNGPRIPYFPEPESYSDTFGVTSALVQPASVDHVQAEGPVYEPPNVFAEPDRRLQTSARTAASQGNKELFDVTALAAMLRSPMNESTDALLAALHDLGTRLFQLFARWDEAEKRWGKTDLPEVEDGTRNAFDILGDTIRFYQDKDVRGIPGVMSSTETSYGPDIDTAAQA